MKKITLKSFVLLLLLAACSTQESEITKIANLEIKLYSETETVFDKEVANQLINAYIGYIDAYPQDDRSAEYLFKSGEVAMGMNMSQQALEYYKRVYIDYPNFDKASTSLFLEGFVYETQQGNNAMAQKCYNEFLEKYPNHTLADDAKFSLEHLGKSDEEIIKEFEQNLAKNQQQDSIAN